MTELINNCVSNFPGFNYQPQRNRKDPSFRLMDKYSRFDSMNGKDRGHHYESSMMSSDLETTTFLESDDDASSRITATTGINIIFPLDYYLLLS